MFTLEYAKNPIWNSDDGQQIVLTVKWQEFNEEMPFAAMGYEWETPHGKEVFNRAKAGEFGIIAEYVPPPAPEPIVSE